MIRLPLRFSSFTRSKTVDFNKLMKMSWKWPNDYFTYRVLSIVGSIVDLGTDGRLILGRLVPAAAPKRSVVAPGWLGRGRNPPIELVLLRASMFNMGLRTIKTHNPIYILTI